MHSGLLRGGLRCDRPKNQTVCLVTPMFTEPAGANCACGFLVWFLIPTQAGLANTRTVGYLGGGLRCDIPKNQTFCLLTSMFIELECSYCAWSFLLWSLIPTKAGLANMHTVGYLGGVLGAIYPKSDILCVTSMFIEPECSNCAWSFFLWSLIPSKAGLANTPTVGYLGGVLGVIYIDETHNFNVY